MSFPSVRRALGSLAGIVVLGSLAVAPVLAGSPAAGSTITVTATEYHYSGLPTSVPAGTSFSLVNAGTEVHELLIARRNPGTTETWDELVAMPEDQVHSLVTIFDPILADPGTTADGVVTVDQEGDYIAICFVPQGLTTLGDANGAPDPAHDDAPSHFTLGKRHEVRVTPAGTTPGPLPSVAPMASPAASAPATAARTIELDLTASLQIQEDGAQVKDIAVTPGETITFKITNTAGFSHDFYIGSDSALLTAQVTDLPGVAEFSEGTQEFTWTVPDDVTGIRFGCTVPGHYQLMNGTFSVAP